LVYLIKIAVINIVDNYPVNLNPPENDEKYKQSVCGVNEFRYL